jgi:hypothetical protein
MKKHIFLLSAVLALTSLTYCHKENTTPDVAQNSSEVKADAVPVEDRSACTQTVTITGGFGVTVCGNLNPNPNGQNNCAYCQYEYGAYVIDTNNPVTLNMQKSCFTIWNNSGTTRNLKFEVLAIGGTPCADNYSFAPGQARNFCIARIGNCCRLIETFGCDG